MSITIYILVAVILLVITVYNLILKRSSNLNLESLGSLEESEVSIDSEPDTPQSFGHKMAWCAIPAEYSDELLEAFSLDEPIPANWSSGIQTVYSNFSSIYISPKIDGWTLILGACLPSFDDDEANHKLIAYFEKASKSYPNIYFFATHRVVEYHAWVKVEDGKIVRAYAYLGERGETLYDHGEQTVEEKALNFSCPTESDVVDMAKAWSIDVTALDQKKEVGVGWLTKLK